jgi:hypothetical protein
MDMRFDRFDAWNVRSLCRAGSVMVVVREIVKCEI